MRNLGRFMTVEQELDAPGLKKHRWIVRSKKSGEILGYISWYVLWRQYTFNPTMGTTFNAECLLDIAKFLKEDTNA